MINFLQVYKDMMVGITKEKKNTYINRSGYAFFQQMFFSDYF